MSIKKDIDQIKKDIDQIKKTIINNESLLREKTPDGNEAVYSVDDRISSEKKTIFQIEYVENGFRYKRLSLKVDEEYNQWERQDLVDIIYNSLIELGVKIKR